MSLAGTGTERLPKRIKQTQGLEQRAPYSDPGSFSVTPPWVTFSQNSQKKEQLPPTSLQPNFEQELLLCHSLFHKYSFYLCTELMLVLPLFNVCLVSYMFSLYLHISVSPSLGSRFLKAGNEQVVFVSSPLNGMKRINT